RASIVRIEGTNEIVGLGSECPRWALRRRRGTSDRGTVGHVRLAQLDPRHMRVSGGRSDAVALPEHASPIPRLAAVERDDLEADRRVLRPTRARGMAHPRDGAPGPWNTSAPTALRPRSSWSKP